MSITAEKIADEVLRDNRIFDFAWGDNPEGLRVVLVEKISALLQQGEPDSPHSSSRQAVLEEKDNS